MPRCIVLNFHSQPVLMQSVAQTVFQRYDLDTVLHDPLEKAKQVSFLAADLAHTVNMNAVNFPGLDLPHHFTVAGAQQPAGFFVSAGTDNFAAILLCFRCTLTDAAQRFNIIAADDSDGSNAIEEVKNAVDLMPKEFQDYVSVRIAISGS